MAVFIRNCAICGYVFYGIRRGRLDEFDKCPIGHRALSGVQLESVATFLLRYLAIQINNRQVLTMFRPTEDGTGALPIGSIVIHRENEQLPPKRGTVIRIFGRVLDTKGYEVPEARGAARIGDSKDITPLHTDYRGEFKLDVLIPRKPQLFLFLSFQFDAVKENYRVPIDDSLDRKQAIIENLGKIKTLAETEDQAKALLAEYRRTNFCNSNERRVVWEKIVMLQELANHSASQLDDCTVQAKDLICSVMAKLIILEVSKLALAKIDSFGLRAPKVIEDVVAKCYQLIAGMNEAIFSKLEEMPISTELKAEAINNMKDYLIQKSSELFAEITGGVSSDLIAGRQAEYADGVLNRLNADICDFYVSLNLGIYGACIKNDANRAIRSVSSYESFSEWHEEIDAQDEHLSLKCIDIQQAFYSEIRSVEASMKLLEDVKLLLVACILLLSALDPVPGDEAAILALMPALLQTLNALTLLAAPLLVISAILILGSLLKKTSRNYPAVFHEGFDVLFMGEGEL
jgi:hypothetical protein